MYTQILYVKSVEHKTLDTGSELYEAWCQDIRISKDGKEYTAFTATATFWGSTPPCEEGQYEMIQGDLIQQSWKDKNTGDWKYKNVINNARILNVINGADNTPKSKVEQDIEADQELPF